MAVRNHSFKINNEFDMIELANELATLKHFYEIDIKATPVNLPNGDFEIQVEFTMSDEQAVEYDASVKEAKNIAEGLMEVYVFEIGPSTPLHFNEEGIANEHITVH